MSKLTNREKYSYGVGALGKDLALAAVSYYIMVYFTDVVNLSPTFVGVLFLVARLWDAVNDPAMGMLVDNTRTKFGKFRPWILAGTILNAVVMVFLFTKPDLKGLPLYAYFSITYILWGMTYTMVDIPYWSMLPSLTKNKEEREKVAVVPRIFASIAWLLMGTFGLQMIAALGKGNDAVGYSKLVFAMAIVFVILSLITCFNTKENTEISKKSQKVTFKDTLSIIKKNDQLLIFIIIVLGMNLIFQISGGISLYYFTYVTGNKVLFSVFNAFAGFAEIGGLMLFPILARKLGRVNVFKLGAILPILGFGLLLIVGFIAPTNVLYVSVAGIIYKLGAGLLIGSTTVMLADVVDYGQFKLGSRNESIVFSVQTLLVKAASAVSGFLVGVGLDLIGYVPNVAQSASTILGFRVLMIGVPIVCAIVMFIVYKSRYKLNGKFHDEIIAKISNEEKMNSAV